MTAIPGTWFDGRSSRAHPIAAECVNGMLQVRGAGIARDEPLAAIEPSAPLAGVPFTLRFADGARLQLPADAPIAEWFPGHHPLEWRVNRWERRGGIAAAAAVVVLLALFALFEWGVPAAGDYAAMHMPAAVDRVVGRQSLAVLRQRVLEPSTLPAARQAQLQQRVAAFSARIGDGDPLHLYFFHAPALGANAFSLGGGIIVVTDALVRAMPDDDALLAVVAHEMGHQHYRHTLRMVLRGSGIAIVVSVMLGDVSGSTIAAAVPVFLLSAHYSRGFEAQADGFALAALQRAGISPLAFMRAMRALQGAHPGSHAGEGASYLSTHPLTQDRIARALAAARAFARAHPK